VQTPGCDVDRRLDLRDRRVVLRRRDRRLTSANRYGEDQKRSEGAAFRLERTLPLEADRAVSGACTGSPEGAVDIGSGAYPHDLPRSCTCVRHQVTPKTGCADIGRYGEGYAVPTDCPYGVKVTRRLQQEGPAGLTGTVEEVVAAGLPYHAPDHHVRRLVSLLEVDGTASLDAQSTTAGSPSSPSIPSSDHGMAEGSTGPLPPDRTPVSKNDAKSSSVPYSNVPPGPLRARAR
jgi:hypothetical protein